MQVEQYQMVAGPMVKQPGSSVPSFNEAMERKLKDGWQPYGNPFVHNDAIWQAVVQYKNS